ncbi:hypothetical protein C8R45DRAFT_1210637 [Mycena sanguinolenta]|nr:hypothetical protein C8R45DRAFT_1210637 [Mycena sanguinolenta]
MNRVPAEVWLEIFNTLNKKTLFSVHRVSRSFHRISRLLLFKHFTFYPHATLAGHVNSPGDIHIPGETEVKRIVRRLRFWASDEVAPLVKECTVAPWLIVYEELRLGRYVYCQNYDVMLHTFLEFLPRFTNLGKLNSTSIRFKQHFIDALGSLPNLREIELRKCSLDKSVMARTQLKAARLLVANTDDLVGVQKWLSIIDLQVLTQFSVQPPYGVATLDFIGGDIPAFPNIRTLEIRILGSPRDVIALKRFPAVQALRIFPTPEGLPLRDASEFLFPLLDTYQGPPEFLVLVDPRATPRQLHIDLCSPLLLLQVLQSCIYMRSVTALTLTFDRLPTSLFRPIVDPFLALVDFRMVIKRESKVGDGSHTANSLFLELADASPFSPVLENITIICNIASSTAPTGAEVTPAARAASATLAATHPGLRRVHLAWPQMQFVASRKRDGKFRTKRSRRTKL